MSARSAIALLLVGRDALAVNVSASPTTGVLCGGKAVVSPSADWLWSRQAVPSPSCTSPAVQNIAKMCDGDLTSVVIQGNGQPQCLSAQMPTCKFNMHKINQLDFDVDMIGCGGTWAAPLWMTPDYWAGDGNSGEIDMMENCPVDAVYNNFAGGGDQVRVTIADPNSFQGHTTMWNQADEGTGVMSIHVKTCDPAELQGGSCPETGSVAYYHDIYAANGCNDNHDCTYTLISDIWNGVAGDIGFQSCTGGQTHQSSGCHVSVTNIRFKASPGTFTGKCAPLVSPSPTPTPPPSAACSAHPGCVGLTGDCCPTSIGVMLDCCKEQVTLSVTDTCDGTSLCSGYTDGDCSCTPGSGWNMWTCTKRQGATIPTTWCSIPGCDCNTATMV